MPPNDSSEHYHPRVLIEPRDGAAPVRALMDRAVHSIRVKMFAFTSPTLLEGLTAAQARGVDVRVMLNPSRSSGDRANDDAAAFLQAGGVTTQWTCPRFAVTHEKSMVVDGQTALIATFNFSDKYFTQTRDYGLIFDDPAIVHEVMAGFEADWTHQHMPPSDESSLLWSSRNARQIMAEFIDTARHSLWVQHPKYSDSAILDRLLQAHERGVHIRVICGGRHGISASDMLDTFSALRILKRGGIPIHKQHALRLHAKLLVADEVKVLVGSMNIDRSAFDLRRELGAVVRDAATVEALRAQFEADWNESRPYEIPDPMALHLSNEPALAPDAELDHE